jgi:hypothetical protein
MAVAEVVLRSRLAWYVKFSREPPVAAIPRVFPERRIDRRPPKNPPEKTWKIKKKKLENRDKSVTTHVKYCSMMNGDALPQASHAD